MTGVAGHLVMGCLVVVVVWVVMGCLVGVARLVVVVVWVVMGCLVGAAPQLQLQIQG